MCGEPWHLHEAAAKKARRKTVTLDDCVTVLGRELEKERQRISPQPIVVPWRPVVPNRYPPYPGYPRPYWTWSSGTTANTTSGITSVRGLTLNPGDQVGKIL